MKRVMLVGIAAAVMFEAAAAEFATLEKARFIDKCRGAWAGQMFGVCYAAPYEFVSNTKPITEPLREWKHEFIHDVLGQDDCYVEMTFLKAIEDHGLDITYEQAGKAFAATEYPLWHANYYGRENVRRGIMPPLSGHPDYNRHADDIDFQIEADLFGILCPGLPVESNRLCGIFGRIMNYGDGVYGGKFVAGMYAAAYFEDRDVRAVIDAGLACIPAASRYHQCISDVIRWHAEHPEDWLAVWHKIEEKWQDDVDCMPGDPVNIDAKLNGAYIVMGLLYGGGDMMRTAEIATRCGQDADCNASNATGVLACMKGFSALAPDIVSGIADIADKNFIFTDYSFNTLIEACTRVTEAIIVRTGGEISGDIYRIRRQAPTPPAKLEQWDNKREMLSVAILPSDIQQWHPAWRVAACGNEMSPGLRGEWGGRANVLVLHPVSQTEPAAIEADLEIPAGARALVIDIASDERGDFVLGVLLNGKEARQTLVDTAGKWTAVEVDVSGHTGKTLPVRLENRANGWSWEAAYLAAVTLR